MPERTAAQLIWTIEPEQASSFVHHLSRRVLLNGHQSGSSVELRLRFDPTFDGVSLPYNLYAVMIVNDGEPVAWWDFTNGCQGPGISFFPGREVVLPKLKLVGGGADRLQIMVWGKL